MQHIHKSKWRLKGVDMGSNHLELLKIIVASETFWDISRQSWGKVQDFDPVRGRQVVVVTVDLFASTVLVLVSDTCDWDKLKTETYHTCGWQITARLVDKWWMYCISLYYCDIQYMWCSEVLEGHGAWWCLLKLQRRIPLRLFSTSIIWWLMHLVALSCWNTIYLRCVPSQTASETPRSVNASCWIIVCLVVHRLSSVHLSPLLGGLNNSLYTF